MELVTSLDAEARRLLEAADFIDKCNGYTISRTEAASAEAARVCSQLLTTLSSCRPSFLSLLRRRSKWMDQQYDETDAVQKLLERSAAAASGCANDAALVFSLLASVLPLCEESGLMRLSACVETVHGVFDEAAEAGKAAFRVQTGVDEARCMRTGPGLRGCTAGPSSSANSVSVLCVDEFGEEVKGLATELVNVNIPGCVVGELSVGTGSNVSFEYALVDDDKAMEIVIDVTLAGTPLLGPLTVPVLREIKGNYLRVFSLLSSEGITSSQYVGIALNSDGTLLAASNVSHHTISVFTLPGGAHLRDIGGKTVFKSPGKICLAPNGNILVAEEAGRRVQECTFEGVHVRTVGKDLNARVWGIAASPAHVSVGKHLIAVGKEDGGAPVVLFDFKSGEKLREFDTEGKGMRGIFGLRVSHAGQILVLDSNNSRVRVFSKTGALVWSGCKGVDSASDVCWGPGGEILVAERGSICRVSVWSPDGTVASKHFHLTAPQPLAPTAPTTGTAPSPFTAPILLAGSTPSPEAFALSDSRQLYVLDRFTSRVWVFE